ncbi:sugar kinase [Qingshengfaniella alkalisoli]|uniref:Sugar kinase n=1 Tax=Qingshengfaniella alkalisoli TaxID=2599296 RepID=A0A5B8IW37_9RHOB|nr:sugar kinase [Qingshengfaniella alkalisoli]QDY70362.1 sugar kinase [Qingshengfaniella alkalisoli]
MAKVLTVGEILVEIVATTKGDGFREAQPLIGPFPSGAPAIFIDQVGKLGTPCAILGRIGDDDFGQLNLDRLRADGVDVSGVEIAPGESTGSAFVRYREDGSRVFVFNIANAACGTLPATPHGRAVMDGCTHMHVMGTALAAPGLAARAMEAIEVIRKNGGTLSFDPNLRPEILNTPGLREALDNVLEQTDLFLPSGDEIFLFTEAQTEAEAAAELLERGVRDIVIKRGADGASHFNAGGRTDAAAIAVEELDPTGAGDCFGGAFVSFWLNGADPATALTHANAAGARAVTRLGPMEGTSTRAELATLLATTETA